MLTAIETTGTVSSVNEILLDEQLPLEDRSRVRVIVLFDESDDLSERDWLAAMSSNEAFDFLADEAEDIYTLEDGQPI
jgi:hypothetical protein